MTLPRRFTSIRFVLTLWYTVVLLFAFAIFGGSVYIYLQHLLNQTLEQDLAAEVDWIVQLIDLEQSKGGLTRTEEFPPELKQSIAQHFKRDPRNYVVLLSNGEGRKLYESEEWAEEYLRQVPPGSEQMEFLSVEHVPGSTLRVASLARSALTIRVAFPERYTSNVLGHVVSILALLLPVVLVVSLSGGWFLSGLALSPVDQITERAARISALNLSERIPPRNVNDELGRLITTINYMIARLESSFENMKQFSMNVAHELKTPLTILRGEAELALGKPMSGDETQQFAGMFLEETGRMAHVIDDLLTLARAEAGTVHTRREVVHLAELIQDLFDDAVMLASRKEVDVELTENVEATIIGDSSRLRQLFRALISNAVQYTDAGGTIRIRATATDQHVCVHVEDSGIGIPRDSMEHIFTRFYRVDQARTREKGGSGLGLALAKWIVEAHRGTIAAQSEVGRGSVFTVTLPRDETPPPDPEGRDMG
jgi:heavy metal sensor kinase